MNSCKLSNKIFDLCLTYNEFAVYVYLLSIHTSNATLLGDMVKVKQSTIAQKCNINTVGTVSRIISSLKAKGLINSVIRGIKTDGNIGTYSYVLYKFDSPMGYFFVDRKIFNEGLSGKELKVYLYIIKCYSSKIGYMWNSYNDLSKGLNMKRSDVIEIVSALCRLNVVRKQCVKSRANKRVFTDNRYYVVFYVKHSKIRKKGKKRSRPQPNAINCSPQMGNNEIFIFNYTLENMKSQYVFLNRGSP